MPKYQVWYKKNLFQDTDAPFESEYVPVMRLEERDMERVWMRMQGESWSPNGEAREAIESLDLSHTSMSIGDVIENLDSGAKYVVARLGFERIE